jgi:hypothetical protein
MKDFTSLPATIFTIARGRPENSFLQLIAGPRNGMSNADIDQGNVLVGKILGRVASLGIGV